MPTTVHRDMTPGGHLTLSADDCQFTFRRIRPGALLITIAGHDTGQLGAMPLDEIRLELLRNRPLELFIDTRDVYGASVNVSDEWTQFFSLNREHLRRVIVLAPSKAISLTVAIAQHFSGTGSLIRIVTDETEFETLVAQSATGG